MFGVQSDSAHVHECLYASWPLGSVQMDFVHRWCRRASLRVWQRLRLLDGDARVKVPCLGASWAETTWANPWGLFVRFWEIALSVFVTTYMPVGTDSMSVIQCSSVGVCPLGLQENSENLVRLMDFLDAIELYARRVLHVLTKCWNVGRYARWAFKKMVKPVGTRYVKQRHFVRFDFERSCWVLLIGPYQCRILICKNLLPVGSLSVSSFVRCGLCWCAVSFY